LGVLLAADNPDLANSSDPIGVLADPLPTWFLIPFMFTAVGGLVAGAVLDIYSSGLNLLTLGVRLERYKSVLIDGALMLVGNIYLLFFAESFVGPFIGFLITLGVGLASWAAIFLVDLALHRWRQGYRERELYTTDGHYGAFNVAGVVSWVIALIVGLGLVTSTARIFSWTGYFLDFFADDTAAAIGGSSIGLLIAFFTAGILYAILSRALPERGRVLKGRTPIDLGAKVG
jgi:NCS1 family nucleobase:cation symporter-1